MTEKELRLPRMGETMDEGTIVEWRKQPGEQFRRGDTLIEVESDKINVEVPALEDGEMVRHLVKPGEKVAVDQAIAVVRVVSRLGRSSRSSESVEAAPLQTNLPPEQKVAEHENDPDLNPTFKTRASPAARRAAKELGIGLSEIEGSGPRGRIMAIDVREVAGVSPHSGAAATDGPGLSALRWGSPKAGTCVLLHGFAGDPTTWRRTGEFLRDHGFEAIAMWLPGHGSQALETSNLEEIALDLATKLSHSGSGKVHLVGHSLGGALAILITAAAPDRIASLTLLAPFGIGTYIDQSFLDGIVSAGTIEALERELRKTTARPLSYAKSALAGMLASQQMGTLRKLNQTMAHDSVQQLYLVPKLEKITVPIRVLFGRQDRILNWKEALSLPGKVALHLFDAGHMLHWENPAEVLPVLARFPTGG